MILRKNVVVACSLFLTFSMTSAQEINVIPKPQEIQLQQGEFQFNEKTHLILKNVKPQNVVLFTNQFKKVTGLSLSTLKNSKSNFVSFEIDKKLQLPNSDGYTLQSSPNGIVIKAANESGIFNATQTLRQLLPTSFESSDKVANQTWSVPSVTIKDYPRFNWRGYMKDVSRTFYDVDVIKKYLDAMALYKMNTFHWHLTDDQGWRIEIKKYPKLTSDVATTFHKGLNQPAKRSGFYTQEQIKEVVAYAKERNITIVPEIDVPGHSWPAILEYPELGVNTNNYPYHVFPFVNSWSYWGVQFTPNTLDPTKEVVYQFLNDVFGEIATLFPGKYIHFGGDEVRHELWEKEPHVKKFMQDHQLADVKHLQSYFVQRVSDIIVKYNKKPLGWNDILADHKNLPKNTAIMSWLGEGAIKQAAENGFESVATPSSHLYLDISQESRHDGTLSDLAYGNTNSLQRIYEYNPTKNLSEKEAKLVLGVQGNMWTALTQELKDMNIHVFPRLLAISEIGWSSQNNKDYNQFYNRVQDNYERLDAMKIDYFKPGGYVVGKWTGDDIKERFSTITYDVSKKVYANGRAMAGFVFVEGKNYLEIDGAQLLENGQVISEDNHHSLADKFRGTNKVKPYFYNFDVKNYNPNAKYEVRAKVRGAGGLDSKGNFTFNLSPYEDFKATEASKQ